MVPEVVAVTLVAAPKKESRLILFPELIRRVDPDVRDVILIGSAVYAPDLARDYDLVVTTASDRDRQSLLEHLKETLSSVTDRPVDLILRHPDEVMDGLALPILIGTTLWGSGAMTKQEAKHYYDKRGGMMTSFQEAKDAIDTAQRIFDLAGAVPEPGIKVRLYSNAYNELFNAARLAASEYLHLDETRWGQIRHQLPWPYNHEFREITDTLHLRYSYDRNYPKDSKSNVTEFGKWKDKVREFVNDMERRTLDRDYDR
jgi:hypothetical protein